MSMSPKPITPWYPSFRALRGLSPLGLLGLCHDRGRRDRLHLFSPRARHLRKLIAVGGHLQTACIERMQRRVSVYPAVQRLVPRGGRFSPFLPGVAMVIARILLLGRELIEVFLVAANREVAISRPDLPDLQPVIKCRLSGIHTDHEERSLVLPARLSRPDRRLARAPLHRVHAARITVAGEPQHGGILESTIDTRRNDPDRLTGVVQILGQEQSFQV